MAPLRLEVGDAGPERSESGIRFRDPEGLEHELRVDESDDDPLIAEHVEVPREMALEGFDGVRAYSSQPEASKALLEQALGFRGAGDGWEVRGERRGSTYAYDSPPAEPGVQSAGTETSPFTAGIQQLWMRTLPATAHSELVDSQAMAGNGPPRPSHHFRVLRPYLFTQSTRRGFLTGGITS